MSRRFCLIWALATFLFFTLSAQTNTIVSAGYTVPAPVSASPGQVVTLFVDGVGRSLTEAVRAPDGPWPTSLAGISITLLQGTKIPVPILEVRQITTCVPSFGLPVPCGVLTVVTVQIPYQLIPLCPLCLRPVGPSPQLFVTENGQDGAAIGLTPLADQVHVLTSCDVLLQTVSASSSLTSLPCQPMVIHGDGKLVSAANPAKPGEGLAAYAVGLGSTNPPATAGQPAAAPVPTVQTFLIDYNFRANALPTKPSAASPAALFTGLVPKYPGLYQINFVVPPIPNGTRPCAGSGTVVPGTNIVQSNLTVSMGGAFSFDGAGICVAVAN